MEFRDERRTAVIIASGPSAGRENLEPLAGWPVIAVNDCWRLYPDAAILYACDEQWWDRYHRDTENFTGQRWTQSREAAQKYFLEYIEGRSGAGFSTTSGLILHNWNSGAQAMQLAWQFGARRLVLVGFDCGPMDGKVHWFGDHPRGLINESPWQMFVTGFEQMAKDCKEAGIEVINTSLRSKLSAFEKMSLVEAL